MVLLFLNSIGGMEVIVILLFILMFFGSKSIPGIARSLGKGLREIQHASNEIRNEIKNSADQIKKETLVGNELNETIQSLEFKQQEILNKVDREVRESMQAAEKKLDKTIQETVESTPPEQKPTDTHTENPEKTDVTP
jgi:sec-independent protein translocase protein TatA